MAITYKELANLILHEMSPEQQEQDITIFVPGVDEYYPATLAFTDDDCDVLDPGHPILTLE
jgi:hypothetical protein